MKFIEIKNENEWLIEWIELNNQIYWCEIWSKFKFEIMKMKIELK